jgi:uncharacterized protein (TIGR02246 family)
MMFPALSRRLLPACALTVAGAVSACAVPGAHSSSTPTATRSVEALYRSGIAAFNRHDLNEFTSQFADDIAMYTPTGWVRGRNAVRQRFAETFKQFPNVSMTIDSLDVTSPAPRTAIVRFNWTVQPMGRGPAFRGVGSGMYVERNGRWVEVLEHETVVSVDPELRPKG